MATVNKNFRIKQGLVVEGTTGTIDGNNILTESTGDSYILNLVGGATLVKSVDTTVFSVDGSGNLTINANVFDLYGAASSAQSAAQTYADGVAGQAQSAAQSYADNVASQAQSAAESYADGKASQAQSAAESYTDTAVSNLVGMAPSLLDTLEKIDNAIANDANFSTTLLNDIANAVTLAKSYADEAESYAA